MPAKNIGEGIVVVMDVGPGVRAGTSNTFLEQSKKCLVNILQRKIFVDKCEDKVGIVLFGTPGTDNKLAEDDQYKHITVMNDPQLVNWAMISDVEKIIGTGNCSGDWLDALIVALQLLHDAGDACFVRKKIVLMTDFSGDFSDDQVSTIISGLKNQGIDLNVIGPEILNEDEDDSSMQNGEGTDQPGPSNGVNGTDLKPRPQNWNGKPKSQVQLAGEALISNMVHEVDGFICSFDMAIPQLLCFEKRSANSVSWNTQLDIGPNFSIAISGKIKVKQAPIPSWKTEYAHDESAVITSEKSYHLNDDQHTVIQHSEVIRGYRCGATLVPFSDADKAMKYQSNSPRSLSVVGFAKSADVSHAVRAGDQVLVVTAPDNDENAAVALSALIQAMEETDMVAITRRIYNKNGNPVMGTLFPDITKDYECLVWVPLPFKEDVRNITVQSLQSTIDQLTDLEKEVMDDLIDSMNLQLEDDDVPLEPMGVLNPHLQHFFNILTHRALHPEEPIPAPAAHVMGILEAPEFVKKAAKSLADAFISTFPAKKVAQKTKRDKEDLFASGEEVAAKKARITGDDSSLTNPHESCVTSVTPIQDFLAMLGGEAPNYNLICKQMGEVILQLVENLQSSAEASKDAIMSKIFDCLTTFRKESCGIGPATYNEFAISLKDAVVQRSLHYLWDKIKEGNLGLITSEENGKSSIGQEEATAYLELSQGAQPAAPEPKPEENEMEDLLDEM